MTQFAPYLRTKPQPTFCALLVPYLRPWFFMLELVSFIFVLTRRTERLPLGHAAVHMVQRRQSRLFLAKLQAGHIHASVAGSSAMVDIFFFRRIYRLESFDTFFDDNLEPSTARATSNKCEVGMAHKCKSAHLQPAWQQKTRCNARVRKRHHLKKLVPTCSFAYLRICL